MKTIVTICIAFLFTLVGNAQEFKYFEIDTTSLELPRIKLTPIARIEPGPTEVAGEFFFKKEIHTVYRKKYTEIVENIFHPEEIPYDIKKSTFMYIIFNKEKNIMEISFSIHRDLLKYTTEQQWLNCIKKVNEIDLDPFIDIPNEDSFDFNQITIKLFGI